MEENRENQQPESVPEEVYAPRPLWQVWCARVGLVLFVIFVIYQILSIVTGGL